MLQAHEKNFLVIYKTYMTDIMRELKTLKKKAIISLLRNDFK